MRRQTLFFLALVFIISFLVSTADGQDDTTQSSRRSWGRSSSRRGYGRGRSSSSSGRSWGGSSRSGWASSSRNRGSYRYSSYPKQEYKPRTTTTTPSPLYSYDRYSSYEPRISGVNYPISSYTPYSAYNGSSYGYEVPSLYNASLEEQTAPNPFAMLMPKSVRDWFDKTVKQVEDIATEIIKSKEETMADFLNKTLARGERLATGLLDEITKEIMDKTKNSQDSVMNTIQNFERKVMDMPVSMRDIWQQDGALNDTKQTDEALEDIKEKLEAFEKKAEKEVEKEKNLPFAVRNQLIQLITAFRGIMDEVGNEDEKLWNKLKLMENKMYQFQLIFAEASEDLKENVNSLFEALKQVTIPKIKNVAEKGKFKDFMKKLIAA